MVEASVLETVKKFRNICKTVDDQRDAGLPLEIPEVKRINDIQYGPDPKWNLLDLYLPKNVDGKLPILINIHGGGWCYGTKETYQFYGLGMAKRGFAFVNPNYRLAPEVQFPEELDDVDRYIHWVSDHADEYNLDKNNVFLVGDSAGGQMVEQYVTILTNPEYRAKFGYELTDLHFRAAAMNSAAFFVTDPGMISDLTEAYFTKEVVAEKWDMLETEKYITKDFLPCFLTTANEDFIHDQTFIFDGFLRAVGVPHVTKSYGDKDHPEPHVFLINQRDELASQANDEEAAFFTKYME
ncbi:alpha/beta hydrolase [Lactobacillus corticis]|uniref:Lipase n=1 Tax=Lactobacillus corticis TaxID=2201249 RepID=A0A916QHJ8_9LACO|nr:alpha/beta hydrolase [Lactobacillus corticis]GFZ27454.1 lipase [Lactobacillus corticis]